MIPSDPDQIFKIAQWHTENGDPEFAQNYANEAMEEYERIYGRQKETPFYVEPQKDLYEEVLNRPNSEERPFNANNSQQAASIWDRLNGYREEFNNHMSQNWPSYAATVPFLAAGLGGLAYGLQDKKKKGDR